MAIKLPQTNLPSFIMTTTLNITRIPGRCVTDFRESKTSRRLTQLQAVIVDICHTQASKIEFFVASCIGGPPISRFEQRHLWMREDLVYRGYSNKVTWLMHSRRRATRTTIAAGQSPTFYEIQSNLKPSTEIFSLLANMHFRICRYIDIEDISQRCQDNKFFGRWTRIKHTWKLVLGLGGDLGGSALIKWSFVTRGRHYKQAVGT